MNKAHLNIFHTISDRKETNWLYIGDRKVTEVMRSDPFS